MIEYGIGDTIEYVNFGGQTVRVVVVDRDPEIKNGRPGFDGDVGAPDDPDYASVWGYDDQIVRVVARRAQPQGVGRTDDYGGNLMEGGY